MSSSRFYFGKLETKLHFFRTDKRSLFKGVVKVLFSCLKRYSRLQQISQNKIVEYT